MEKVSSMEIDMDEWEFLPSHEHGFINLGNDHIGKSSSAATTTTCLLSTQPCYGLVEMNYFIRPSPQSQTLDHLNQQKKISTDVDLEEEVKKFNDIRVVPQEKDPDPISQVFFKKLNDNSFADIKVESPKSGTTVKLVPDFDSGLIPFVRENEGSDHVYKDHVDEDVEVVETKPKPCCEGLGFNLWRWRIAGIGAIRSIGVAAAATLCIFILGGGKRTKQQHHAPKIQFSICSDDKGIKQAMQQATRLTSKAHISFGGCL